MTKNRIVAVGNGDQLTEVTPYGVLLVHMWDPRTKSYIARSGDWTGTDGVNAHRGLRIGNRVQSTASTPQNATAPEFEAEAPYLAGYDGNGWGL